VGDEVRVTVIATGFDGDARDEAFMPREDPRPASRQSEPRSEPVRLGREEKREFALPDDALEVPDFLK
jgi:hypothetical protein